MLCKGIFCDAIDTVKILLPLIWGWCMSHNKTNNSGVNLHYLEFIVLCWASCRIRTNDPEITNHVLWPTELKRRVGKLTTSHRYNLLPLLRSSPGGFTGSWSYRTYPFCKFLNTWFSTLVFEIGCKFSEKKRNSKFRAKYFSKVLSGLT